MNELSLYKRSTWEESLKYALPIKSQYPGKQAQLVPVGQWILDKEFQEQWELFSIWRKHSRDHFLVRFQESASSTYKYLENFSIKLDDRILFVIVREDIFIGHVGLSNVTDHSADLDNVMKSTTVTDVFSMREAIACLLAFAHQSLKLTQIRLTALSDNEAAINLYRRLGFETESSSPLKLVNTTRGEELVPCSQEESNIKSRLVRMLKSTW